MSKQTEQDFWGKAGSSEKEQDKGGNSWIGTVLIMLIVFAVFGFMGFKLADSWLGGDGISGGDNPDGSVVEQELETEDKRLNFLLLGVDQRDHERGRADTIIVAFLNLENNDVKLLSIPRDTYVQIPGRGKEKIGHAHAYGGSELTMQTVEGLLGIKLDKYVEINFEGFKEMIDTLGGIEMEVEKRMYYAPENIDLQPGKQRLNGYDALAYVRYRSDGDDTTRIPRQQKFLKELAEEVMRVNTVFKLPELIKEANESINTNIGTSEMLSLAKAVKAIDTSEIEASMLPGVPQYINDISYWIPAPQDVEKVIAHYSGASEAENSENATVTN